MGDDQEDEAGSYEIFVHPAGGSMMLMPRNDPAPSDYDDQIDGLHSFSLISPCTYLGR